MRKIIVIFTFLTIIIIFSIGNDGRPTFNDHSIGDEVRLSDVNYEVVSKEEIEYIYDGDLLVEKLSQDSGYVTKYKFYYDDDLLVKEEQYRNNDLYITINRTYKDGEVVEIIMSMFGNTSENVKNITRNSTQKITTVDINGVNFERIVDQLDENGNAITTITKNSNDEIIYRCDRKYEGKLLIESVETRSNGLKNQNLYEHNDYDDLVYQRTKAYDGEGNYFIIYFEYEYDSRKRPLVCKLLMLEEIVYNANVNN